jgi:hypothetical protein
MTLNAEAWLAFGILGFYAFDCLSLTDPFRQYFTYSFAHWSFRIPSQSLRLGRRSIDVFNPIMPWQIQLPYSILAKPSKTKQTTDENFNSAIRALVPIQIILSIFLLLVLPSALFIVGVGNFFLLMFITVYVCIGIALLKIYLHRSVLHLSASQCLSLAVECILCAPFAVNLIRKIGLLQPDISDVVVFSQQHFSIETLAKWREQLASYVQLQQQWYSEDEPMYQKWQEIACNIQSEKL